MLTASIPSVIKMPFIMKREVRLLPSRKPNVSNSSMRHCTAHDSSRLPADRACAEQFDCAPGGASGGAP
jgi:hypothetical protein